MKISIITPNGPPEIGGDIMIMGMLSSALAKMGHNVKWICRHYNGTKNEKYFNKVKIERVKIPRIHYGRSFWFSVYAMKHILNISKDSDILHFDTFIGSYIDWMTRKATKKPSTLMIYGLLLNLWKEISNNPFEKFILPKIEAIIPKLPFDAYITPCEFTRNTVINLGAAEDKVKRIYLGINHKVFRKVNVKKKDDFVIGYLGRMNSIEKNVGCLIKAFKIIKENIPNSKLFLAGPGIESQLKNISDANLEMDKDIINHGPFMKQDIEQARWYSSLDAFISPSLIEGFGLPFIEAQACGTPVVCFNRTAMPEVVKHNSTGLLVNETTPQALANAVINLYNKNLKRKFSINCIKWSKQFTWEKCAFEHSKLFGELIK
jgi:glycosyltransferase involved in cell wall biosynthesis